jgi:hypothetical protein
MYRMERLVPLIGATVAGPLGVAHVPRMWLKGVLSAAGMLYEGYFDDYKGFNQWVIDGIGLEPEAWFAYLRTIPTYSQAEDYIRNNATKLDPASVAAINTRVLTFERPEENAAPVRARAGLDEPIRTSCLLINFDDWTTFHQQLTAHRDDGIEPMLPLVSSAQSGRLGVAHLPRLWMKAMLNAVGALQDGWKSGPTCGFDNKCATTIGLDLPAAIAYINAELPTYVQFEQWVGAHIQKPDIMQLGVWMKELASIQKPAEQAEIDLKEAEAPAGITRDAVLLNDLMDWKYLHDKVAAKRVAA